MKSCPITRGEFEEHAAALPAQIAGCEVELPVKAFSTGSLGWYANQKINVRIGQKLVQCQLGVTLTVVNSKEAAA